MYKQLLFIFLIFAGAIYSTCSAQQWISTYAGNPLGENFGENQAVAIAVCDSGKTCVTGFCEYGATSAMSTIKYGAGGDTEWVAIYQGPGNGENKASALCVDDLGYIYVTGFSAQPNGQAMTTIKYSPDGIQLWASTYIGTQSNGEDKAYAITIDKFSNIFITGFSTNAASGADMTTIKYNSSGIQQWVKTYNGSGNNTDIAYSIALAPNDDIIITGFSRSGSDSTTNDYTIVKYKNGDGTELWVRRYDGPANGEDVARKVVCDSNGNIYVTGYSWGGSYTHFDIVTARYLSNGNLIWVRRYDNPMAHCDDIANSMTLVNYGVIVTGFSMLSAGPNSENYVTLYYDQYGHLNWSKLFSCTGDKSVANSVAFSELTDIVYVTGASQHDSSEVSSDMATVLYDLSTGQLIDSVIYNGPTNGVDVAYDVTVDSSGNAYVTGFSSIGTGQLMLRAPSEMSTLKYDFSASRKMNTPRNLVTRDFILYQNYPNPFNPSTTIEFVVVKSSIVKLTVYNIVGQQVVVLKNEFMKTGRYEVDFNLPHLSSGVYFYEMSTNGTRDVKKMVLVK